MDLRINSNSHAVGHSAHAAADLADRHRCPIRHRRRFGFWIGRKGYSSRASLRSQEEAQRVKTNCLVFTDILAIRPRIALKNVPGKAGSNPALFMLDTFFGFR